MGYMCTESFQHVLTGVEFINDFQTAKDCKYSVKILKTAQDNFNSRNPQTQ